RPGRQGGHRHADVAQALASRAVPTAALPPGPRLPAMVQSLALLWRPLPFLRRAQRTHGDVFTIRAFPYGPMVYVADADLVREVLLRVVIGARDPERLPVLRDALRRILALNPTLLLFVTSSRRDLTWLPAWRRFRRRRAETYALLDEEIRRRRADPGGDDV